MSPGPHGLFGAGRKEGIALIVVLWVITILSVVVMEFSFAMRTEVQITQNYQEELQLYAMAKGGIERAAAELVYKHDPRVQQLRKTWKLEEVPEDKKEWVTDGREYTLPFDKGECVLRVLGEGGKVNINLVSEGTLRKIIANMGWEGEAKDVVADSIMDWRDPDDFYRVNGAENDYYQSLKDPYDCRNGNLESIEELLLVRGVTAEIYYGKGKGKKDRENEDPVGLKDIFSIYAPGEQIDINSAPLPVLRVVLGLPSELCRLIIKAREEKGFDNQQDLLRRVPELAPFIGDMGRLMIYRSMISYYTVEGRAKHKGGGRRTIKAIIKIDPREKDGFKMIQWQDAVMPG